MTEHDSAAITAAVKAGVAEALADLGLHRDEAKEIRQDLAFVRRWRRSYDASVKAVRHSIIVTVMAGIFGLLVLGFRETISSWFR